ncbi:hypothetical protein BLNAU_5411 [Blattamonas nauphoetae]|uniref:BEACH domain-containing protein n=1 Tax=Blattamonas nauphoetae TaxID=2049346 RepID=A0ABQ9Y7F6_9EUKA|nr:hypothetical protein BLNAU_5411 [Blattamonas nauphoetae]
MEWFVEVVLCLDNRLKQWPSAPPLTSDDIQIDNCRIACINPPPSTNSTLRENAFSSDLSVICELFLTALLILEDRQPTGLPLNPDYRPPIFNRMMANILERFMKSGDIIVQDPSPVDYFTTYSSLPHEQDASIFFKVSVMSNESIINTFTTLLSHFLESGAWTLPEASLFRQEDVEHSKELVEIAKMAQKRDSKDAIREEFEIFEGWKGLMRRKVEIGDIKCGFWFLRDKIFRPTLTSLLSKHQHLMSLRPPSLPLPSAHLASSSTDHSLTSSESNQLPFEVGSEIGWKPLESFDCDFDLHRGSSSSLTPSQTGTDPSSASLSLEAQPPPSPDTQSSSSPAGSDTGWMISTLHILISAPVARSSFLRPAHDLSILDDIYLVTGPFDYDETFSVSLFDEEDADTLVDSLFRCSLNFLLRFERKKKALTRVCKYLTNGTDLSSFDSSYFRPFIEYAALLSFDHGIAFPEELTTLLLNDTTHVDTLPPSLYLNHTSLNPKYRRNVFPIEVLFERQVRSDPSALLRKNTEILTKYSIRFIHTPFFGLHSLFIRGLFQSFSDEERSNLAILLSKGSLLVNVSTDALTLFSLFPPPLVIRQIFAPSQPLKIHPDFHLNFCVVLTHLIVNTAPFGDCQSLKSLFQIFSPLDPDDERELTYLRDCRDIVISLHWLNIPSHFDSPLLAHLPLLISSHPPSLHPSLFRQRGIRSLVTDQSSSSLEELFDSETSTINPDIVSVFNASILVRRFASGHPLSGPIVENSLTILDQLKSPFPAFVSVTLEMFHRLVLTCSDEERMELVKHGLLDVVMVAVSQSSFLSDYESGIVVIGGLLKSIHRVGQKERPCGRAVRGDGDRWTRWEEHKSTKTKWSDGTECFIHTKSFMSVPDNNTTRYLRHSGTNSQTSSFVVPSAKEEAMKDLQLIMIWKGTKLMLGCRIWKVGSVSMNSILVVVQVLFLAQSQSQTGLSAFPSNINTFFDHQVNEEHRHHEFQLDDDFVISSTIQIRSEGFSLKGNDVALMFPPNHEEHSKPHPSSQVQRQTRINQTNTKNQNRQSGTISNFMFDVSNSTFSACGVHVMGDSENNGFCLVSSSTVRLSSSSITSNGISSPFMTRIGLIDERSASTIVLSSVTHLSNSAALPPLVGLFHTSPSLSVDCPKDTSSILPNQDNGISIFGTGLTFESTSFLSGTGPLFSFGLADHASSLPPLGNDVEMETSLSSSSLVNMTSSLRCSSSGQLFGSEVWQRVIGCSMSDSTNHNSGTGMLDANVGGNLVCLNSSFSDCQRASNDVKVFTNENITQTHIGRLNNVSSSVTSVSYTLCTFNTMTVAVGENQKGGAAIFLYHTPSSLIVEKCFFHKCSCTGNADDGGAFRW